MEEHVWLLVELFISGKVTETELSELAYLLGTHPDLLSAVKQFLHEYQDPDPQITSSHKRALLARAESINYEYAHFGEYDYAGQRAKIGFTERARREFMVLSQLFKTTFRQLRRERTISFINISGLAIGMATAILIFIWIANELSFDTFHVNKDRIYSVISLRKVNGAPEVDWMQPSVLGPVLKANYPQVEEINRYSRALSFVLKRGDKRFESRGLMTDANFFKFFSYSFLEGNPSVALNGLHSIVLTQKMAKKLFGNEDPVGKVIGIDSTANFTVTGVLKPLPGNTQFSNIEYIVPLSYMRQVHWLRDDWETKTINMNVLFKPGVSRQVAQGLFWNAYHNQNVKPGVHIIVQPMADWWLYSNYENGKFVAGRLTTLKLFGFIAIIVMVIACINYVNLGTARSAKRAKEVGIRKVAGAGRGSLIRQFLGESVLTAILAGILAIVFVELCLPAFSNLIGNKLSVPYDNPSFWLAVSAFAIFTGIIAGVYPAFYLSAFRPVRVLKGIMTSAGSLLAPRRVMVVVQFTLAIVFIICTVIIYRQIDFGLHRSKGYDSTNLAYVYIKGNTARNFEAIKHDLLQSGAVSSLMRTNSSINDTWTENEDYTWQGKNPSTSITLFENYTDKDFTLTSDIRLLDGRDIDIYRYPGDTAAVLLTQSAVKKMGFKHPGWPMDEY